MVISRADLHVHTTFSDGTMAPEAILNYYAVYPELHVVAITDHDTLDGALRVRDFHAAHRDVFHDLEVIVGEEVSSRDGHVVGLFLEHWVPPGLPADETVARIHEQRGLAIAVHPYTHLMRYAGLRGVGDLILTLPFDAVETRNASITEWHTNYLARWRAWSRGLCQVGASDGHFQAAIGRCFTLFEGRTAPELRAAVGRKATRAGGRVWGPIVAVPYLWERWRAGQPIIPDRHVYRYEDPTGELRIRVSDSSTLHVMVLHVEGTMDASTLAAVKEKVTSIPASGIDLVLGLSGVARLDSAGITALISGYKAAARHGTRFVVAELSAAARRALEVVALDRAFRAFPTEAAALAALAAERAGRPPGPVLGSTGRQAGPATSDGA